MSNLRSLAWWSRLPRWLAVPWRSAPLLAALIAATALPAFLLVAAAAWQLGAENAIAEQVADDADLSRSGADVRLEVSFQAAPLDHADALLRAELQKLPATTEADLTLYTLPAGAESPSAGQTMGTPLRIVARDGMLDQVEIVSSTDQPEDGLWISDWYAERFGLGLGDDLRFEAGFVGDAAFNDTVPGLGRVESWTITAIYQAIWDEDGSAPDGYWAELPQEVLPRYLRPLQAPSTSLALVDLDVLADSGLTGFARWRNQSVELPTTLDGLQAHRSAYRAVETSLVAGGPLSDALRAAGAGAGRNPSFTTDLYDTVALAVDAADPIEAPMRASLALGMALAAAVIAATGIFVVEQRRQEFRLLAGEGDGPLGLGRRVAAQLAAPSIVGSAIAVAGGLLVGRIIGPGSTWATPSIPVLAVTATTLAAVLGTGLIAGFVGARTLTAGAERAPSSAATGRTAFAGAAVLATWLWFQTADPSAGRVDLASVSLPVVAFVAAGLLAMVLLDLILRRTPAPSARRRPTLLLGLRRIQAGALPLRIAALSIATGLGLVVASVTLVATFEHAVEAKLATEVGAETRWTLSGTQPTADIDLPPGTVILSHQDTRTSPGGRPTRVVAIDPATLGDPIAWPDAFGIDRRTAIELLEGGDGSFVPAIAVEGEPTPDSGAFGTLQPFPYRVVGRATSVPLAGEFGSTILVSATSLDALSQRFYEELSRTEEALRQAEARELAAQAAVAGEDFDIDEYLRTRPTVPFIAATERFRANVVSDLSPAELRRELPELEPRVELSTAQRRSDADLVGVRLGFEFVRVVGAVALLLSFVALLLHVAARRKAAALSSVMARAVGLRPRAIVAATALEIGAVVGVTVAATSVAVPAVAARLTARFEPLPSTPPEATIQVDPVFVTMTAAGVVLLVTATAALVERRDLVRSPAEVVRDAG